MSKHTASTFGKIRVAVIICCLILILSIFAYAYISDFANTVLPKDEITGNLDSLQGDDLSYDNVSSYVKKYGIGNINEYKINMVEQLIKSNYYTELPDTRLWAEKTVARFVEYYYDNIDLNDQVAVTDAILKCMVSTKFGNQYVTSSFGDDWSYYRTKEEYESYSNTLQGSDEFVGIGIQVNANTLEISMVYKESGAEAAGIKPKDILWSVDGNTADSYTTDELLEMIRGEIGTTVKIGVKRGDSLLEFDVERKIVSERTVYYEITDENFGYIIITHFYGNTFEQFKEAVDKLTEEGVDALIIDVRYNPGGLLYQAAYIVDYLTPDAEGRILGSYQEKGEKTIFRTEDGHGVDLPIAVLCNENSASSAEMFTGAMRDLGDAGILDVVIIGSTTYGKGLVQQTYLMGDGTAITFTIGYFNPPSDVNFNGTGVKPHIEVPEVADVDAPLERAKEEVLKIKENKPVEIIPGMAA